jgi:hypothetical protein
MAYRQQARRLFLLGAYESTLQVRNAILMTDNGPWTTGPLTKTGGRQRAEDTLGSLRNIYGSEAYEGTKVRGYERTNGRLGPLTTDNRLLTTDYGPLTTD